MDRGSLAEPVALLEREQEVERVRTGLRAAGRRTGSVLVIEGAPGVGKSRLLAEAREAAPVLGVRVLAARATDLEHGFPYGVMRQLFERTLLEAGRVERERWLSGAAALAADVLTGVPTVASGSAGGGHSYAWQHGLYWLASNLSAESPLALVVDDLQWCDAPSASALAFIARRLEGQPLTLILATRPLDPAATPEAATLLAEPGAELLHPPPLTHAAVCELVAARWGSSRTVGLCTRVWRRLAAIRSWSASFSTRPRLAVSLPPRRPQNASRRSSRAASPTRCCFAWRGLCSQPPWSPGR